MELLALSGTSHGGVYQGSVTTTTLATIRTGTGQVKKLYVLLDTGSSNTILSNNYLEHIPPEIGNLTNLDLIFLSNN